jgi:hypothetical protein
MSKIKNNSKSKKRRFKKPEWNDFLNITQSDCKGMTNKNNMNKKIILQEFFDVYCVIKKYKPVATVNISNFDIRLYNKYKCAKIINKLTDLANDNEVKAIINNKISKERVMVVFDKKHISRAILTLYIFTTERGESLSSAYLTGKVLGYSEKAIKEFYDDPDTMIDDLSKYYYIYNRRHYVKMIKDIINSNDYKKFKQKYKKNIINVPTLKEMNKKYLKK